MADQPTRTTVAAYDQIAVAYAARWIASATAVNGLLGQFTAILPAGSIVVDLGCGPGRDTRLLRSAGFQAVGLDLSAGMLHQVRLHGPAPLVRADLGELPFHRGVVDGAWACASLLHIPKADVASVLDGIHRMLRPGGWLALILRQGDGEGWTSSRGARRYFAWWQSAELDDALHAAGFDLAVTATVPDQLGRARPWLWRLAQVPPATGGPDV